jgi:hypothetical protein
MLSMDYVHQWARLFRIELCLVAADFVLRCITRILNRKVLKMRYYPKCINFITK